MKTQLLRGLVVNVIIVGVVIVAYALDTVGWLAGY